MSASYSHDEMCRAFGTRIISNSYPGLTAGPINWRPFGPENALSAKSMRH